MRFQTKKNFPFIFLFLIFLNLNENHSVYAEPAKGKPKRVLPSNYMFPLKGGLLGLSYQSFTVNSIQFSGISPLVGAFGEKRINDQIKLRATFSIMGFNLKSDSTPYTLDIYYFTSQLGANYTIARPFWIGAQLGYFIPVKEPSTELVQKGGVQAANTLSLEVGYLLPFQRIKFLPLILSYNIFLNSPGVSANYIALQTGLAVRF